MTTLNDFGDGSLRTAIANADGGPKAAYTIDFESGLSGTINLGGQLPALGKNITITGPGADSIVINGASSYLIFDVASGKTCVIGGLVLSQGAPAIDVESEATLTLNNCQINNCSGGFGGGINNGIGALLNLNNTSFLNDTAENLGGAIYNYGGQVNFYSGSITLCSAQRGGGIYTDSDGTNYFTAIGDGVLIQTCNASDSGGGIYVARGAQDTGTGLTMGYSTLSGNTAGVVGKPGGGFGGGIYIDAAFVTLTGTTIQNNTATNFGGGFFENSGDLKLSKCIGGGNTAPAGQGPGGYVEPGASYSNDGSFTDEVDPR